MTVTIRTLIAVLTASASFGVVAAGNPEAGAQKAAACMACHGADGNSPADIWPKLAGQVPEYIVKQLQDFKAKRRENEQMSPQAANVAEADMADIAAFFGSQTVKPGEGDRARMTLGEQIYKKGKGRPVPVTACIGCHGPAGAGNKNWNKIMSKTPALLAPGIGGQHVAYIDNQLKSYREGKRTNDPAQVMRLIARGLSDEEIAAVAAYVATLKR